MHLIGTLTVIDPDPAGIKMATPIVAAGKEDSFSPSCNIFYSNHTNHLVE